MTVQEIYHLIDQFAPFETQEAFDNSGLLLGDPLAEVTGIHFALDVTASVIRQAQTAGANLIVTHHPLMFSAKKRLCETDYEAKLICEMIRSNIALISAHTNLDQAKGGIDDTLALICGITNPAGEGYLRHGMLAAPLSANVLVQHLESALHTTIRVMGQPETEKGYSHLAVSSGAGGDFWEDALSVGAQVFLTGEMKHHLALACASAGLLVLEAGHYATEVPGIFSLADTLQKHLNHVNCTCRISKSSVGAYGG